MVYSLSTATPTTTLFSPALRGNSMFSDEYVDFFS